MSFGRKLLLVVTATSLIACEQAAGPSPQTLLEVLGDTTAMFQTDHREYLFTPNSIGHQARIGMNFVNSTGLPVYMVNCSGGVGWSLERFTNGRWQHAYAPIMLACLSHPIIVSAGEARRLETTIFAARPGSNINPKFEGGNIEGIYRVVWHGLVRTYQLPSGPWSNELPLRHRLSNAFILRAP
jgi:hypothetical protein